MFTVNHLRRLALLAAGLAASAAQAQPYGPPQPGYPQAGYPQANVVPTGLPAPAPVQPGFVPPIGAPVVIPEPPVRLGFQFAMCDYGMAVNALREGGLAQQVGLLPGDIIVQINTFAITGWDQYCLALQDAVYSRGGQVEMWLYRPTPAGYELQYVAYTIHEEQIIVVVPCSYHYEKCHGHHVSCWTDRLVWLNNCWKQHCHDGGKAHGHHGLNLDLLGKGGNLNFNQKGLNVNLGNLIQKHGNSGFNGQFQNQLKHFSGSSNFQKHLSSQLNQNFKPKFNSQGSSNFRSSHGGGNSMKNLSSQFSRSGGASMMKSFGGFGKK